MCRFCDWGEAGFEAVARDDPEAMAKEADRRRLSQVLWRQLMQDIEEPADPANGSRPAEADQSRLT